MTDESSVNGGMSGKIHSVRASENEDEDRGGGEGDRRGGEEVRGRGERERIGMTSNAFR